MSVSSPQSAIAFKSNHLKTYRKGIVHTNRPYYSVGLRKRCLHVLCENTAANKIRVPKFHCDLFVITCIDRQTDRQADTHLKEECVYVWHIFFSSLFACLSASCNCTMSEVQTVFSIHACMHACMHARTHVRPFLFLFSSNSGWNFFKVQGRSSSLHACMHAYMLAATIYLK